MKNFLLNKIGEASKKQKYFKMSASKINLDLLNKYSEDYIKKTTDFQSLEKVEVILVELTKQKDSAKKDEKENLQKFIDIYQVQQKALIKEAAIREAENNKGKNEHKANNNNIMYIENENKELVLETKQTKENAVDLINLSEKEFPRLTSPTKATDKAKTNGTVMNPYGANNKKNSTKSPKRKKSPSKGDNGDNQAKNRRVVWNNTNITDNNNAANKLFRESMNNSEESNKGERENDKEIRIRFSFKANTMGKNGQQTHVQYMRELLYEMIQCAKVIDKEAILKPWKTELNLPNLNGNELKIFARENISEYIDTPEMQLNVINGRTYYRNGLRIRTRMDIYEFTERWNNNKYTKEPNNPFQNWRPIKAAEMQSSHNAYPIGYFVGTSERGDYTTINKYISEDAKANAEVSFQFVNQAGVTPRLWKYAREQAEYAFPNPFSKEHKKVKFDYAPSALVVYVSEKNMIKQARRNLIEKYGKLVQNHWPQMRDGLRMRFIPIMIGKVDGNLLLLIKRDLSLKLLGIWCLFYCDY